MDLKSIIDFSQNIWLLSNILSCTQLCDFKYSHLILIVCKQLYGWLVGWFYGMSIGGVFYAKVSLTTMVSNYIEKKYIFTIKLNR